MMFTTPAMASVPYCAAAPSSSTSTWSMAVSGIKEMSGEELPDGEVAAIDVQVARVVAAVSVHQNQCVVGRKAAQRGRKRKFRGVIGILLGTEGGDDFTQGLAKIGAAGALSECGGIHHRHRFGTIRRGHARDAGAGNNHLLGIALGQCRHGQGRQRHNRRSQKQDRLGLRMTQHEGPPYFAFGEVGLFPSCLRFPLSFAFCAVRYDVTTVWR